MDELVKFFDGLKVPELTQRQCLAAADPNGFATFNLILPGDPISLTFSGIKFEGKVAGTAGNIKLEYKTPQGAIVSSRSAGSLLGKVPLIS